MFPEVNKILNLVINPQFNGVCKGSGDGNEEQKDKAKVGILGSFSWPIGFFSMMQAPRNFYFCQDYCIHTCIGAQPLPSLAYICGQSGGTIPIAALHIHLAI